MELTDEDRQSLLEAPGLLARARKLLEILIREQQLAELKNQIQERVKQEIDKQQRDYYLQQQMRTIQDELGDGADADIEKMREEAKKKNWPKEVGETFEKELQKVERLNPAVFGADDLSATVARTAVERHDQGQPRPQVRP